MKEKSLFRIRLHLLAFVLVHCSYGTLAAKDFVDSEIKHVEYPTWFKESFLDLKEDLNEALATKKLGLMVLFTTEGCSYCDFFIQRSLHNPQLVSVVQENFDSIGLEIFDDSEITSPRGLPMRVKQFAKQEGAEFSPTLLFYGRQGETLLKVVGYQSPERFKVILDYVIGQHFRSESLRDYFNRRAVKAAAVHLYEKLKDDPLFMRPPYALDRSHFQAEQPLLVVFEEVGCKECEDFHADVLVVKEVRAELKKFDVVRFDVADDKTPVLTPDGKKVTPAGWFQQIGFSRVPGLLFFDTRGNEVLKTDALVLRQRMMNSLHYVLEGAYKKGWTYQRYARSQEIERQQKGK